MKANNTLLFILLIFSAGYCQQQSGKMQHFIISADGASVDGINVVNLSTNRHTASDAGGAFALEVNIGDLLVLTAVHLEYHRVIIDADDLADTIQIKMMPKVTELNETRVNAYSHINAESLGIIPAGQKKYTVAERRLKTAGDFKPIHLLGLLGGSLEVDPIINAITGRTAMLKKELSVEKKEQMLARLDPMFTADYYRKLAISDIHIGGFKHYIVAYPDFDKILYSGNSTTLNFAMAQLAGQYNQIISEAK